MSRIAFIDAKCRKRGSKAGFTDGLLETSRTRLIPKGGSSTNVARPKSGRLGRAMAVETSVEVLEITLGTT